MFKTRLLLLSVMAIAAICTQEICIQEVWAHSEPIDKLTQILDALPKNQAPRRVDFSRDLRGGPQVECDILFDTLSMKELDAFMLKVDTKCPGVVLMRIHVDRVRRTRKETTAADRYRIKLRYATGVGASTSLSVLFRDVRAKIKLQLAKQGFEPPRIETWRLAISQRINPKRVESQRINSQAVFSAKSAKQAHALRNACDNQARLRVKQVKTAEEKDGRLRVEVKWLGMR